MANAEPVGVALVGCGLVAPAHVRALRELPDAALRVVCARQAKRVEAFAEQWGLGWSTDYAAVLRRPDIQLVIVTAPPGAHEELVCAAARAGKHVIVEKPLSTTVAGAERMIAACREAGVKLGVIFQNRWRKSTRLLKASVDRGDLGELLLGDVYVKWFRAQSYYDQDAWRGTIAGEGGGCLINQGIHYLDALLWVMGPVEWVFGQTVTTAHHRIEVEDLGLAMLRFRSGALGTVETATALKPGLPDRLAIHGSKGTVILEGGAIHTWKVEGMDEAEQQRLAQEPVGTGAADPMAFPIAWHRQQLQDMLDAIRADREPAVNGPEGLHALRLVHAIYESSRCGQRVALPR